MNIQKTQRIIEIAFGLFLVLISGWTVFTCIIDFIIDGHTFLLLFAIIMILSGLPLGLYCLIGHDNLLELRTARIHEMTAEGVIHSKDKSLHISSSTNSADSVSSVKSYNGYIVRVRTEIGFFDVYSQDAYMTYKEGDKVKILVKIRYNRKGKAFKQETTILGLLSSSYK